MRVGVSEAVRWVVLEGYRPVGGVEVELARRFAREVGSRIEWVRGSEEELVDATKEGQVDLILGGLTNKSRWKKDVAFTRPYVETRAVVGVPPRRVVPGRLRGRSGGGRARQRGGGPAGPEDRRACGAGHGFGAASGATRRRPPLPARRPRPDRQRHRARRGEARDGREARGERVPRAAGALPARL